MTAFVTVIKRNTQKHNVEKLKLGIETFETILREYDMSESTSHKIRSVLRRYMHELRSRTTSPAT